MRILAVASVGLAAWSVGTAGLYYTFATMLGIDADFAVYLRNAALLGLSLSLIAVGMYMIVRVARWIT